MLNQCLQMAHYYLCGKNIGMKSSILICLLVVVYVPKLKEHINVDPHLLVASAEPKITAQDRNFHHSPEEKRKTGVSHWSEITSITAGPLGDLSCLRAAVSSSALRTV